MKNTAYLRTMPNFSNSSVLKTKIVLFIAFILLFNQNYAQRIGITGGTNIANLEFSAGEFNFNFENLTTLHLGFVYEYRLVKSLFLNTGLIYSEKGFEIKEVGWDKYHYLEIPLNIQLKAFISDTFGLFVQCGPYGGYTGRGTTKIYGEKAEIDYEESGMRQWDYGLGFGGGIEIGKRNSVLLGLNYQKGLAKIMKLENVEVNHKIYQIFLTILWGM